MSEDNPDVPRNPPPPQQEKEEPPEARRGSMLLGIVLGTPALYALYFGGTSGIAPDARDTSLLTGPSTFIPIAVYLMVAILLAAMPRTSQWGAGLLIGLGFFTLFGGGICVGYLAQMRA